MSEKTAKIMIRTFLPWNDAKEEAWLRSQALRGWHFESVAVVVYRFRRGQPADITYRLDYPKTAPFDKAEYLGLFRDAGWEYVGRNGAWYYFRTPTGTGRPPEILTDTASRVSKYTRLLVLLGIVAVVLLNGILSVARTRRAGWFWTAMGILETGCLGLAIYTMVRLAVLVARIKKTGSGRERT